MMFKIFKYFYAIGKTFLYLWETKVRNVFCFYLVLQFSFLIQYILCHAIVYDIIIFRYPISLQWKTANDVQINWYAVSADLKTNPKIWPLVLKQKLTLLNTRLHWLISCIITSNQYISTRYSLAHCCNTLVVSQMHV